MLSSCSSGQAKYPEACSGLQQRGQGCCTDNIHPVEISSLESLGGNKPACGLSARRVQASSTGKLCQQAAWTG